MASLSGGQVLLFGGKITVRPGSIVSATTRGPTRPRRRPIRTSLSRYSLPRRDKVLLFGGWKAASGRYGDTWVYDLSANTWTDQTPPTAAPSARFLPAMASLGGDQALLFGGDDANGYNGETWVYDSAASRWTYKVPPAARPRDGTMPWRTLAATRSPVWRVRCQWLQRRDLGL